MHLFYYIYVISWALACLIAVILFILKRKSFIEISQGYWRFLFRPWKSISFIIAASGLTMIAPYTGDPTWDYVDAAFMSILTYLTAPWAIGIIYKVIRRELSFKFAYVVFCIWMFSTSWSYDLYILIRDGNYPITWFSNIFASAILYVLAGLLWNLDWTHEKGVTFSFMTETWFISSTHLGFKKVLVFALPIMVAVALLIFFIFLV